ncbi:acyltransferase family-domain-containing protein [Exophiala viscosa]|uniref:acyltransferase family-domain-containing protein n=1 Tax=Exophiala viscosa TaxID=2486360 RepID=UPI00219D34C6|nr:acyltransferase family-domain-containing protein [Exophiala viscosa]
MYQLSPKWLAKALLKSTIALHYQSVPLLANRSSNDELDIYEKEGSYLNGVLSHSPKRFIPRHGEQVELTIALEKMPSTLVHYPTADKIRNAALLAIGVLWTMARPSIFLELKNSHKPLHPTAFLDGMRGVAAFFVVLAHVGMLFYPLHSHGWSSEDPHFFELPIIRLLYSGAAMVTIFFIISGYALSYKPLLLLRKGARAKVFDTLASAMFRRGVRLFLPVIVVAFWCVCALHFDLNYPSKGKDKIDPRVATVGSSLWWWFNQTMRGLNPFIAHYGNLFDQPFPEIDRTLWTIPVEYRGSVAVFALILIFIKTHRRTRLGLEGAYLTWLTYVGQWDIFLFVAGMVCCEIHHITNPPATPRSVEGPLPSVEQSEQFRPRTSTTVHSMIRKKVLPLFMLFPILYILTQPENWLGRGDAPLYATLDAYLPPSWSRNEEAGRFWPCIAAIALVLLVQHTPILRRLFTFPPAQYLGKISYSLYLVHRTLLNMVLARLRLFVFSWTAKWISLWWLRECFSLLTIAVLFFPLLLWVADLFTRYVDQASVELAKWLENKCCGSELE